MSNTIKRSKTQAQTKQDSLSRRKFLQLSGGCGVISALPGLSALLSLNMTNSAMASAYPMSDYKAMVCIQLAGGIDSFNLLTPYENEEYTDYQTVRGNLALAQSDLLPISDSSGRQFGLHPGLGEMQNLYNLGVLAFQANVGTLVQPTTLAQYLGEKDLPLGLFSHSDQQQHWQTSVPQSRAQISGWAGRMADVLTDASNNNSDVSMNIALSGVNILQTGRVVSPYVIQDSGATLLKGYNGNGALNRIVSQSLDSLLAANYANLLEKAAASRQRVSIDAAMEFNEATNSEVIQTRFPDSSLGKKLEMVAKTIASRTALGQKRQTFFIQIGGWDHHDDVINKQALMLPGVSSALKAFYDATVELGVAKDVVTFSMSDFARTLTTNGNGSDHAWGGNHFVMGGDVSGTDVYGSYPESLAPGNPFDVGRGRLLPTTSVDQYHAEIARWFGVPNDANLEMIFPNIRNFYSASDESGPIGFMNS
ncbi:MAG: DUF1501 domain-containing protein [Gammaproteobacteria bacterium]